MSSALSYFNFFPYSWHYNDEEFGGNKQCIIRVFGWNERNETVCLKITDFNIPVWVEFPMGEEWTDTKKMIVLSHFKKLNRDPKCQPVNIKFEMKEKLYYANIEYDGVTNKYKRKCFPFMRLDFRTSKAASYFSYALKEEIKINELSSLKSFKFIVHTSSNSITPVLKCMAMYNLPSASWIRGRGRLQTGDNKESTKAFEYNVSCKDLIPHTNSSVFPIIYPKVLSWDIETFSKDENSMPKADRWEDVVFLISCVISEYKLNPDTNNREKVVTKYCLSAVDVDENEVEKDTNIVKFKNEYFLLKGFSDFIRKHDPDILIGYNIMGYDLKYMLGRATLHSCHSEFLNMGCIPGKLGREEKINWGSSARGKQDMVYIEAEGRMWIDMLPYIRMNNNFGNYKLSTVCQEILKTDNKDDLKIKDMFRYYREKNAKGLGIAMNYCTQDSNVVLKLWDKCLTWFDLTETSTVCCVPPFYIVAKAQQIRIVSQMLNYCMKHNIVLETNVHKAEENAYVEGAIVTEPRAALYSNVVSLDFSSLYPSIIRAFNIDYTTLVTDDNIPDEVCHTLEWETHMSCNCPKSDGKKPVKNKNGTLRVICRKFRYRWIKDNEKGYKGVIPTLIKNLLDARKNTRKQMEKNQEKIEELEQNIPNSVIEEIEELKKTKSDENKAKIKKLIYSNLSDEDKKKIEDLESLNSVLNKKQLAFKVSANSQYGAMGASAGYLPLLEGAASVTFKGRESVMKATNYVKENHNGKVIYNDTDSLYVYFLENIGKSVADIWDHAVAVAEDTTKLFPPPMSLAFEDAIYSRFLIFSKKRYVALICNRKGEIEKKWKISGIVLKRRDNCTVLKDLYKNMIEFVLYNTDELIKLTHVYDHNKYIEQYKIEKKGITAKKRKEENDQNKKLEEMENQMKEWENISRKNETVRKLMNMVNDTISEMFLMNKYKPKDYVIVKGLTKDEYTAKTLPCHVAVSNRMKERGQIVQTNDRISYILLDKGCKPGTTEKQDVKAEDFNYYLENCEWMRPDYLFYLEKQIIIPCDQIFEVACGVHGFLESLYQYRLNQKLVLYELKQKNKPKIEYIDT
jgi:DNA polymerase elongation subunit (family B)